MLSLECCEEKIREMKKTIENLRKKGGVTEEQQLYIEHLKRMIKSYEPELEAAIKRANMEKIINYSEIDLLFPTDRRLY